MWQSKCHGIWESPQRAFSHIAWKEASAGATEAIRGLRASRAMTHTNRWCASPQVTTPTVSSVMQNQGTSRTPSWARPAQQARRIACPVTCQNTKSPGCTRHTLTISFESYAQDQTFVNRTSTQRSTGLSTFVSQRLISSLTSVAGSSPHLSCCDKANMRSDSLPDRIALSSQHWEYRQSDGNGHETAEHP